ncbi:hypothetical protein [Cupriavidus pauculus]|uniref:hypothetical protein n=1 Tax=Cupriavidus pauculus TaxID=82633 RepID=UPI003857C898
MAKPFVVALMAAAVCKQPDKDTMKKVFQSAALLAGFLLPAIAAAQGVNVGMPLGSNCPTAYHWEMAGGFAQCIADAPPVPPVPPVESYGFVYLAALESSCNMNGCTYSSSVTRFTRGSGSTVIFDGGANGTVLPWGFDMRPVATTDPPTQDYGVLNSFMQPFSSAGCLLAADNSQARGVINSIVGFDVSNSLYAGMSINGITAHAANFALCKTAVM